MDLSYTRFEKDAQVTLLSPDLAVLLVGVAARQALSPTAQTQIGIERHVVPINSGGAFAPVDGAFSGSVADLLALAARGGSAKP